MDGNPAQIEHRVDLRGGKLHDYRLSPLNNLADFDLPQFLFVLISNIIFTLSSQAQILT